MKATLPLIFSLLSFNFSFSQITFEKTYGGPGADLGTSIDITSDGGYILCGYTHNSTNNTIDAYVLKLDATGDTMWTKIVSGSNDEVFGSITNKADSGYTAAGYTGSFGQGMSDMYLVRMDASRNVLWAKTYGGAGLENTYHLFPTADGGYLLTGFTWSFGAGSSDLYAVKTDNSGNLQWTKTYGGTSFDYSQFALEVSGGGYLLAGTSYSFSPKPHIYLVRTDDLGDTLWTKSLATDSIDEVEAVYETSDGGFMMVGGTIGGGAGDEDILVMKIDSSANVLWAKTYGNIGNDLGLDIKPTSDGNSILTGWIGVAGSDTLDLFLAKINSTGDTLWTKIYGGAGVDRGYQVKQVPDGSYIVVGYTDTLGTTSRDIYVIKTDANGDSKCNEVHYPVLTGSAAFTVNNTTTVVSSGGVETTVTPAEYTGANIYTLCTTVGTREIQHGESSFTIYPNPALSKGSFTISFDELEGEKGKLKMFDIAGRCVYENEIRNFAQSEIRNSFSPGVYFVKVSDGKRSETKKLIIQ
jgi:hypothetical protein